MKLTLKLKNQKYCNDCPCFWAEQYKDNVPARGCLFNENYGNTPDGKPDGMNWNRKTGKFTRPKQCIKENG